MRIVIIAIMVYASWFALAQQKPNTADMGMFDSVTFPLPGTFYDNYENRKAAQVQDMTIDKTMLLGYDLNKHNLANNTLVIYLSDQGFYMGEHGWFDKRFMYEESFRTPLMMRYPGVVKPGTVSDDFVMNVDIAPTLLDAAGVVIPKEMQGESISPLLTNKKTEGRNAIYYHYYENGEHSVSPHFGIKTKRYKLIRFYEMVNAWELYDLQKDLHEIHNLYGKKGYEKITADLKAQLQALIDQYEDGEAEKLLHSQ